MPLWHDLRFAARMLRRTPAATVIAVLALGLGIGINTSVFCVLRTALWRPMAVERPEEMVGVRGGTEQAQRFSDGISYADYVDLRDQNQSFTGLVALRFTDIALSTTAGRRGGVGERGEAIFGEFVSGNCFDVLGIRAELGRMLGPDDDRTPGGHPVVVISHALWQRRFGGDPDIVGRTIHLNTDALTVIGVAPKTYKGAFPGVSEDFWVPMMMWTPLAEETTDWMKNRAARDLTVLGRLRPGVDLAAAQANVQVIWQSLVNQFPETNKGATVGVVPELQARYGTSWESVRLASLLAQLVAALVLLVSCANVANLLLAKASGRAKEIAIRQAMGASRLRLVRQLLTESLLLALLGGALGLIVAVWCGELFHATLPVTDVVPDLDFTPDFGAFVGALGISLATGLLFGLAPAWRTSQVNVVSALKTDVAAEGQGLRRFGLRQVLVIAQLAISIVVVVSGALFVRSLRKIEATDPGYRADSMMSVLLDPGMLEYRGDDIRRYFADLQRRVEGIPGVRSTAITTFIPLNGVMIAGPVVKDGDPPPRPNEGLEVSYAVVGLKYFATAGTDVILGRDFTPEEHEGAPRTAIVNQELARRLFGDEANPLGKRFRAGGPESTLFEIVGVARDGKYQRLTEDPAPHMFLPEMPSESRDVNATGRTLLVRAASASDLPFIADQLRNEVAQLDIRIAMQQPMVGEDHLKQALYLPRVAATVGTVLGLVTLFLATIGVYGLMSYGVSQRTKEMGIRMALGGQARDVLLLVMRQGTILLAMGLAVGSTAAFAATRATSGFLFGVSAADPWSFLGTILLLGMVATISTFIPALRATRVDPIVALRCE